MCVHVKSNDQPACTHRCIVHVSQICSCSRNTQANCVCVCTWQPSRQQQLCFGHQVHVHTSHTNRVSAYTTLRLCFFVTKPPCFVIPNSPTPIFILDFFPLNQETEFFQSYPRPPPLCSLVYIAIIHRSKREMCIIVNAYKRIKDGGGMGMRLKLFILCACLCISSCVTMSSPSHYKGSVESFDRRWAD